MKNKKIYIIAIIMITISILIAWRNLNKVEDKKTLLNVISTSPNNNSFFVDEKAEIIFTLNRLILNTDTEDLKIEISPLTQLEKVYLNNKIRISPTSSFLLNTQYEIKISYKNNLIYTLNFETTPFTDKQIKDEGKKQTEGDLAFNEVYNQFLEEKPWYRKIPIERDIYTIVYDFELLKFRAIMNRKITDAKDKEEIVKKIIEDLSKIGIKSSDSKYVIQEVN